MPRAALPVALVALAGLTAAGCGGGSSDDGDAVAVARAPKLTGSKAQAPAPAATAALSRVPVTKPAQTRIGYVNLERIGALDLGRLDRRAVEATVLGRGARHVTTGAVSAVQVGAATVLRGRALPTGTPTGADGVVVGGNAADRRALADSAPQTNVIAPETPSAVQSCLGDATAQTIVGPAVLGRMSAIGAGIAPSTEVAGRTDLLVCAAPHFRRDLYRIQRRLERRFGRAAVGEQEIGERDIVGARVALADVPRAEVLALLRGGQALVRIAKG